MVDSMNIKERLIAFYSDTNRTAYADLSLDGKSEFKDLILSFLRAEDFQKAEIRAKTLKRHIFSLHGKQNEFEGALKDLYEIENNLNVGWQRLHFVHQANVFLLGLYLYDISPQIKTSVNREMKRTSGVFLSNANETGEFLFRWRMATIVHDLGYAISLSQREGCLQNELATFTHIPGRQFENVADIYVFRGENEDRDLLKQIRDRILSRRRFSITSLVNYLKENNPYNGNAPFYDHGILSAVIFLHLINDLYGKHEEGDIQKIVAGRQLVWNKEFLDGCFTEIAMAVALHNLDAKGYEAASLNLDKYYTMQSSPFAWLLKVSDMLQEWDKPKTDVAPVDRCLDSNLTYDIMFEDRGYLEQGGSRGEVAANIIVNDFPCETGKDLREKHILEGLRGAPINVWIGPFKYFDA